MTRPKVYTDEQRREAIKNSKNKYLLKKPWFCDICKNNHEYKQAGNGCHLKTKKHCCNLLIANIKLKI